MAKSVSKETFYMGNKNLPVPETEFQWTPEMVEDLKKDHEIMLDKIKEKTNEDFTNSINYFTQAKYDQIRKRILDVGNECDRNLINFLGYFDSAINVKKVEEAAQQKAVYKKTIISQPVII